MQIMYSQIFVAIHAFVEVFLPQKRGPSNAYLKISKKESSMSLEFSKQYTWESF